MRALIALGILAGTGIVFWLGVLVYNAMTNRQVAKRNLAKQYKEQQALIHRLEVLASQHHDIAPELSFFISQEIYEHKQKEVL